MVIREEPVCVCVCGKGQAERAACVTGGGAGRQAGACREAAASQRARASRREAGRQAVVEAAAAADSPPCARLQLARVHESTIQSVERNPQAGRSHPHGCRHRHHECSMSESSVKGSQHPRSSSSMRVVVLHKTDGPARQRDRPTDRDTGKEHGGQAADRQEGRRK